MAGILDFYSPQGMGGILSPQPQMASWQQPVGLFGAALRDAGAYLSGHPADANAVQSYGQQINAYNARQQAKQAVQAAQSSDPTTRQQGYAAMVGLGLDPSGIQKMQSQAALPQLLQNLQPSMGFNDNPVGVTPAVNAPGSDAARAAALATNAAPAMSMQPSTLSGALQRTGVPELTSELALPMIQSQMASQQKIADAKSLGQLDAYTPIPQGDPAYAGYRKGTILGRNQLGDTKVLQQSDLMSPDAYNQKLSLTTAERNATAEAQARLYGLTPGADMSSNPAVQSWVKNVRNGSASLQNVPMPIRGAVSMALTQDGGEQLYTPTTMRKYTLAASQITKPFTDMSAYKLTADAKPYLDRIAAASEVPGSVSDQDILDSLTKLNTGGNAVTDAQVRLITDGKSLSDWAGVIANKLANGGVLSDNQRNQIKQIAGKIYDNYRKSYQPLYDQASSQLKKAGIPKEFWTIPDLNSLNSAQSAAGGQSATPASAPSPGALPKFQSKTIGGKTYINKNGQWYEQ
jgi:hypothetical protein